MVDSDGFEGRVTAFARVRLAPEGIIRMGDDTSNVLTDDEQKSLDLVTAVRTALHAEHEAQEAVKAAIRGDVKEPEREKLGVALRDARQALADARVALVEHAMGGAK